MVVAVGKAVWEEVVKRVSGVDQAGGLAGDKVAMAQEAKVEQVVLGDLVGAVSPFATVQGS